MADEGGRSLSSDDVTTGKAPVRVERDQSTNTIAPAFERERQQDAARPTVDRDESRAVPDEAGRDAAVASMAEPKTKKAKASLEVGDVPEGISERYFTEKRGSGKGYYPDAQTKEPAFVDTGNKLSTERTDPNVVSDMLKVAEHRGWEKLEIHGTPEFRREVWLQAQERGIEVTGYKPTERDHQELERREQSRMPETGGEMRQRNPDASTREAKNEKPSAETGVTGKLVEVGEAPYQGRKDAEPSAFVKLEMDGGQTKTLWGVGLPDALSRAEASIGDTVTIKRDGFEQVTKQVQVRDRETGEPVRDKETGKPVYEEKAVQRGMWTVTAEKFLNADRETRSADPAVREADSQMRVVQGFVNQMTSDPAMRERLMEGARQEIAKGLSEGARYTEAKVYQVQRGANSVEKPVFGRRKEPEPQRAREKEKPPVQREAQKGTDAAKVVQQRMVQEKRGPERERSR